MKSNNVILKTTTLKEFVEFAYSIKEMEEVKNNGFPVPKTITFKLDDRNLKSLQKEILEQKKMSSSELEDEFEVELYGITFKFSK